eukprot:159626-Pleurochrysis_carterae.AAC.2
MREREDVGVRESARVCKRARVRESAREWVGEGVARVLRGVRACDCERASMSECERASRSKYKRVRRSQRVRE